MSFKTNLKRIALVVVSALGFGFLAAVPSQATFSRSIALSTTYLTVVGAATETNASSGLFYVDITNDSTGTLRSGLRHGLETMTVTVVEDPDGAATVKSNADLVLKPVRVETTTGGTLRVRPNIPGGATDTFTATEVVVPAAGINPSNYESSNFTRISGGNDPFGSTNRYWFAVGVVNRTGSATPAALDAGYYKLRVRVQNSDSAQLESFIFVRFVKTIADAGATLTVSATGPAISGESLTLTTNQQWTATLRDPNSGRIQLGTTIETSNLYDKAPVLDARILSSTGTVLDTLDLVSDTGTVGVDHVATTSTDTGAADLLAARSALDGVYGITDAELGSFGISTTNVLSVRVQNTAVSRTAAITTRAPSTLVAASTTVAISADGIAAADRLATATGTDEAISYTLPLSAKSVVVTVDVGSTAAAQITSEVDWSGNYATANVTPASDTRVNHLTDADGSFTVTLTNSTPLAGAVATITLEGYDANEVNTITLTWAKAVPTTISVVEPVSGVHQRLKGTTTFSVSVTDQFGAAVSGALLQPSLSASSSNYSATTTYAAITTAASGIATWSLTDASAVADGTDVVSFASIDNTSATAASYTITYKSAVAVVGSFLTYYNHDFDSRTASDITVTVPTTGISTTAGGGLTMVNARDLSTSLLTNYSEANGTENDMIAIKVRALTSAGVPANGAAVTITAGTGAHVVGVTGLPAASRTIAVPSTGDITFSILATAPGAITWTITSGTASTKITANVAVPTQTAARFVTVTGGTNGSAFGEGVAMTATVTDRYGNGVSGVNLTLAASGVGSFAGGATTQSFTTDSTGKYTFLATSNVAAGGTGTFTATMGNAGDATSSAGYVGSTDVDDTLKAGNVSASAAVTFAAGVNPTVAAAEAASDAALEAIDAANAATDAANLAAEAADAATVAAEEARDAADAATAAVEALASEVATLIAGLKAQITTLANTVAKIAKRVRA